MQRHGPRHFTAYTITAFVYVVSAGFIFYSHIHKVSDAPIQTQRVIQMSLSAFVPEIIEPPKKIVVEKEIIEEIVEEVIEEVIKPLPPIEPEPIVEPIPKPILEKIIEKPVVKPIIKKIIPKKIVKKKIVRKKVIKKKLIVKKKVVKKKKVIKKKKVTRKATKTKATKPNPSTRQSSLKKSKASSAQRSKFFGQLRGKIQRYKSYPRIARKRGMEGSVKVRFSILKNGRIGKITVSGSKIFHNAAREAVKKAFPINVKKCPISLPETIILTLKYEIR